MEMNEVEKEKAKFVKNVLLPILREPSLRTNVIDAEYKIDPNVRELDWYFQADRGIELPRDLDHVVSGHEWVILKFSSENTIGICVTWNSHMAIVREVLKIF